MIYIDEQSKQQLDRSSQSVIDGYKAKFRLSNSNLQALKEYLYKMQDNVEELRKIMDDQVLIVKEQLDDATDIAGNLCQNGDALIDTIGDLETGLDDIEDDLTDLEKEIEDEIGCLAINNDSLCSSTSYSSCGVDQTCISGCQISDDCSQGNVINPDCNESSCGTASETCPNSLDSGGCEATTENTGCSNTSECDIGETGLIILCGDTNNSNETNCGYYAQYDNCVSPQQDGSGNCYTPNQMGCDTSESYCYDPGLAGCSGTDEDNYICVNEGLAQCIMEGQDHCGNVGQAGYCDSGESTECNQPGQAGCTLAGQANCLADGQTNPLCSYYGLNGCYTGEDCSLNGLAGCSVPGEAGCMFFGQAGGCSTATVSACGTDFGSCMSVTLCGPAYGEAAGCGGGEGCGWVQTCGSTCDGGETGPCGESTPCSEGCGTGVSCSTCYGTSYSTPCAYCVAGEGGCTAIY